MLFKSLVPAGTYALILALAVTGLNPVAAEWTPSTISVSGTNFQGTFGEGEPAYAYFGQTFIALNQYVTDMTFGLRANHSQTPADRPSKWRLLLTETNGYSETNNPTLIKPTTVLFESDPFSYTTQGLSYFNVDFGKLPVTPGSTYMWILDSYVEWDGAVDYADVWTNINNPYPGGHSVIKYTWPGGGTRASYFSANWNDSLDYDRAFTMTFIPEPSALVMAASGLIGLAIFARRRRSS